MCPRRRTIWSWTASGQCDLGLVRPRSGYSGVICEPFLAIDAVCALPRGHALAARRVIEVGDLAEEPLIAGATGVFQQAIEASFAAIGLVPRFGLMAQYTAARCGLVAEGLGIAIVDPLPARALANLPIVLRPFRPRLPIETLLIRPAGRPPGQAAERLVRHLLRERDALVPKAVGGGD